MDILRIQFRRIEIYAFFHPGKRKRYRTSWFKLNICKEINSPWENVTIIYVRIVYISLFPDKLSRFPVINSNKSPYYIIRNKTTGAILDSTRRHSSSQSYLLGNDMYTYKYIMLHFYAIFVMRIYYRKPIFFFAILKTQWCLFSRYILKK